MLLRIQRVTEDDIGLYRCVSSNSMGSSEGLIRLHRMKGRPAAAGRGRSAPGPRRTSPTEPPPPLPAASAASRPAPPPAAAASLLAAAVSLLAAAHWRH